MHQKSSDKKLIIVFLVPLTILIAAVIGLTILKQDSQPKKPVILSETTNKLMTDSQQHMKEAQDLLSKKKVTPADVSQAQTLLTQAVDEAKKATEEQPDHPTPWFLLSQQYEQLINVNPQAATLAEDAINHALALNKNDPLILRQKAQIAIDEKKWDVAKQALIEAVKLAPQDANYHFKLGNVYKELGDKTHAREEYLTAKKLTPEKSLNMVMIDTQLKSLDKPATSSAKDSDSALYRLK